MLISIAAGLEPHRLIVDIERANLATGDIVFDDGQTQDVTIILIGIVAVISRHFSVIRRESYKQDSTSWTVVRWQVINLQALNIEDGSHFDIQPLSPLNPEHFPSVVNRHRCIAIKSLKPKVHTTKGDMLSVNSARRIHQKIPAGIVVHIARNHQQCGR